MKLILTLMLITNISIASESKLFISKEECYKFCDTEFHSMMKNSGLDLARAEDVGTYIAAIIFKTKECKKNCDRIYNQI